MPIGRTMTDIRRRAVALLESAIALIGGSDIRWKDAVATFRRGASGERVTIDFSESAERLDGDRSADEDDALIEVLAKTGWSAPPEIFGDFERWRRRLRPRIIGAPSTTGRDRAMCRRDLFAGLLAAVRIGSARGGPYVSTRQLDDWGLSFEELLPFAAVNQRKIMTPEHLHEVEGAAGVMAVVHEREPGSAGYFILDALLPDQPSELGVVFAVPDEDVMLMLPVVEGGGAEGLAIMVELAFRLTVEGSFPLSDQLFWRANGRVIHLPTTVVEEGKSRRIHVDASGAGEELFRILGALE